MDSVLAEEAGSLKSPREGGDPWVPPWLLLAPAANSPREGEMGEGGLILQGFFVCFLFFLRKFNCISIWFCLFKLHELRLQGMDRDLAWRLAAPAAVLASGVWWGTAKG